MVRSAAWIICGAVLALMLVGCKGGRSATVPAPDMTAMARPSESPALGLEGGGVSAPAAPLSGQEGATSVGGVVGAGPDTGGIAGRVLYQGPEPPTRDVSMSLDPKCASLHGGQPVASEDFVLGPDRGLKWVFVYVKEGVSGSYPPPAAPVVLDQQGCTYHPHVFGVMVGQPLQIRNSDPLLHNVHAQPRVNKPFNLAQAMQGNVDTLTFDRPEIMIPIRCDVHNWMQSWCGVVAHPFFAVTSGDGRYAIQGLPPAAYTLEFWHERLGVQTQKVVVRAGETVTVDCTFSP